MAITLELCSRKAPAKLCCSKRITNSYFLSTGQSFADNRLCNPPSACSLSSALPLFQLCPFIFHLPSSIFLLSSSPFPFRVRGQTSGVRLQNSGFRLQGSAFKGERTDFRDQTSGLEAHLSAMTSFSPSTCSRSRRSQLASQPSG